MVGWDVNSTRRAWTTNQRARRRSSDDRSTNQQRPLPTKHLRKGIIKHVLQYRMYRVKQNCFGPPDHGRLVF